MLWIIIAVVIVATGLFLLARRSDFLLCDKEDFSVACAIELDDGSHNSKRRPERDEFLKGVCETAGVPLIQVPAKSGYVISEVRSLIPRYLTVKDTLDPQPSGAPEIPEPESTSKLCPNCSTDVPALRLPAILMQPSVNF